MKSVSFIARPDGDCECFCWRDVSEEDMIKVRGEEKYKKDLKWEIEYVKEGNKDFGRNDPIPTSLNILYPNDVLTACGILGYVCEDKKYKFTISVEEIGKE